MNPAPIRLVIAPNASLRPRQAVGVFALIAGVSLLIAIAFAVLGYWPILPFAGLELLALGLALWASLRAGRYREVITVDGPTVSVESGLSGRGPVSRCEMDRRRARVWLEPGSTRHEPGALVLSGGGQRMSIGRCLTDAERLALCERMKGLIGAGYSGAEAARAGRSPATL